MRRRPGPGLVTLAGATLAGRTTGACKPTTGYAYNWRVRAISIVSCFISVTFLACGPNGGSGDGADGGGGVDGGTTDASINVDAVPPGCESIVCPADQHCEIGPSGPECVNNNCQDLVCDITEECVMTPGGGAICEDNSCGADIDCAPGEYCDGVVCQDDVCVEGTAHCIGGDLYVCAANGSEDVLEYTCGGGATFMSECQDDGMGSAACTCEDDWDCPQYTRCEGRVCVGTGDPPQCLLPPEPFANALPVSEIQWGGTSADLNANSSPFSSSSQVVQTVGVANLDDDNNDGIIDDRDIPEIVFVSFCGDFQANNGQFTSNGVLRAIHGGGPNKGEDFFANCGGVHWREGDSLPVSCNCNSADLDSTASVAVADVNYDGVPEIVAITEGSDNGSNSGRVRIYSNDGAVIAESGSHDFRGANPAVSIHNIDNEGNAELVVGRHVFGVDDDLNVVNHWEGSQHDGTNGQGPASCVANFDDSDTRMEVLGGSTLYRLPVGPAGVTLQSNCTGMEMGDEADWCNGVLPVVWDGNTVDPNIIDEGFCSSADVWGADLMARPGPENPLDGTVEAVIITNEPNGSGSGDDEGFLQILDGKTGALIHKQSLNVGRRGGPPNIDDFDGDGFPEVGTAGETEYVVFDLQQATTGGACDAWTAAPPDDMTSVESVNTTRTPPGGACNQTADCGDPATFGCNVQTQQCICLHNSWRRTTEDDSSRVTGSSVFDFNGDGAAEVVYNDECRFRIYDGFNGDVYLREPSESRTRIEYPVVADVDNDGNAEIVFSTSNESGFCSEELNSSYNNGIEVWGDQQDFWVSARRIWNQHAYSVTNVTEDGMPPLFTPDNWRDYNGRAYNVFRSNPRTIGIAPDLVVAAVQYTTPGAGCGMLGDTLEISVQIENRGDVRGGQGTVLSFVGEWGGVPLTEPLYADGAMTPLTVTLADSIDPGGQIFVTVSYDVVNNSPNMRPENVIVTVDDPTFNPPNGFERECDENNALTAPVIAGDMTPDLRVELGTPSANPVCPTVPTTVFNDGSVEVSDVLVRFYAGDPFQGGAPVHDEILTQAIPPGGSVMADVVISGTVGTNVTLHAIVDPDNVIVECNDGNNSDAADAAISCQIIE